MIIMLLLLRIMMMMMMRMMINIGLAIHECSKAMAWKLEQTSQDCYPSGGSYHFVGT